MSRATRRPILPRTPPDLSNFPRVGVVALVVATLLAAAGCGAAANGDPSAPTLQRVGSLTLAANGRGVSWRLPPHWRITMQAWFPSKRSTLRMQLASSTVTVFDGSHVWHRVELTDRGLLVDGRHSGSSSLPASRLTVRAARGPVAIRELVIRRASR